MRELIFNALVHKDYGSGVPIQISVYADKLYVANVGSLPETWTVETLMSKHVSRPSNPTIAGCIYLTGKIETWGRGVEKVVRECRKHGCPKPQYSVNPGEPGDIMVKVEAAPDAIVAGLAKSDGAVNGDETINETISETINETIKLNPGISLVRLTALIGKSRATVARGVGALVKEGRIQYRGSKKTGGYFLKG